MRFEWLDLELVKSNFKLLDPLWNIPDFTSDKTEVIDMKPVAH